MLLLSWCPFKIQKEKQEGLQFTSTDYLSLLLTPLRIRWTKPLSYDNSLLWAKRWSLIPPLSWADLHHCHELVSTTVMADPHYCHGLIFTTVIADLYHCHGWSPPLSWADLHHCHGLISTTVMSDFHNCHGLIVTTVMADLHHHHELISTTVMCWFYYYHVLTSTTVMSWLPPLSWAGLHQCTVMGWLDCSGLVSHPNLLFTRAFTFLYIKSLPCKRIYIRATKILLFFFSMTRKASGNLKNRSLAWLFFFLLFLWHM